MDGVDVVVIGAGVIGLACARVLARLGLETLVIERNDAFGQETSARNSEVIHAGMYYPTGSLKARLCVEGKRRLYAYCTDHGIAHRRLGKLIVATREAEHDALDVIAARAKANGLVGDEALSDLTHDEVRALEPAVRATRGLLSPSTGIIDSHGLMLALLGDAQAAGAALALKTRFLGAKASAEGWLIELGNADQSLTTLRAGMLINAAGLGAAEVAKTIADLAPAHRRSLHFARGCYFTVKGKAPFRHLIYPAPPPGSLGIHVTLDLGGQAKLGPDLAWIDAIDYTVDPARGPSFLAAARLYWPDLADDALEPGYAGIRPKLERPGGSDTDFALDDVSVHGLPGLINLFGIESPGLTSCLALADEVARRLGLEPDEA